MNPVSHGLLPCVNHEGLELADLARDSSARSLPRPSEASNTPAIHHFLSHAAAAWTQCGKW
jgi:hypothetical protein